MVARAEELFDYRAPNYTAIFCARAERLARLRKDPKLLAGVRTYYTDHPGAFISDWGVTVDPRNPEIGLPSVVPFLMFPKQSEFCDWFLERWRAREPGLVEKSRDMGVSWLTVALSCTLCLFHRGLAVGFGSRKEEYVDKIGSPKSLFEKARVFMSYLPPEFRGTWTLQRHAPHMRILFPETASIIGGEAGDEIGRGDRTSFYFVDEAAFLEHPETVDAALSQTTNCRIDVSTPNGMANTFAMKRFSGKINVFTFDWRDDPRKDQAWYDKQVAELDPVIVASEIDRNYSASVEGVVIPSAWVQAAIGAHTKLNLAPTGRKYAGLDVADEGRDKNAFAGRHGFLLQHLKSWSGKGGDIYTSVQQAFLYCDEWGYESFDYDADGLGAGVRGDARVINEARAHTATQSRITDNPFRGSGAVNDPEGEMVPKRKNKDFFLNFKAQSYWALRTRFQNTYRAVAEGMLVEPDAMISIDPALPELRELQMELSQPTWSLTSVGKVVIDKQPDGTMSPNRADAVMIAFNPGTRAMDTWRILGGG